MTLKNAQCQKRSAEAVEGLEIPDEYHSRYLWRPNDVEKALISITSLLSIGSLVVLNILDRKYGPLLFDQIGDSAAVDNDAVFRMSLYEDKPPTTIFLSFIIMVIGVDSILPENGDLFTFQSAIYGLLIWGQCSYLALLVSCVINELDIEKGFGWLLVVLCSVVLHSLLFPLSRFPNDRLAFLRSSQSWLTSIGCLFEVCKYSTTNMTGFITYYGTVGTLWYRALIIGLSILHVATMVILGLVLLAVVISSSIVYQVTFEDAEDDSNQSIDEKTLYSYDTEDESSEESLAEDEFDEDECVTSNFFAAHTWKSTWICTMFLPFLTVSIYHCQQLEWAQTVLHS